jgi:hypothetical protein
MPGTHTTKEFSHIEKIGMDRKKQFRKEIYYEMDFSVFPPTPLQ